MTFWRSRAAAAAILKDLWLPALVCGLLACSAVDLTPRLTNSDCEMTWMFTWPQYQKLNLSHELRRAFPQYSLHLYRETRNREEPQLDSTPLRLRGLPVLFIPGNAGSHKQVRSSASIALQMHRREFPHLRHFDFFTVNLNEEFSGLFGGVLLRQTQFVAASIRHILSLYPSSRSHPSSVLIIAHSMGGVVARALFTLPNFPSSLVSTIITLSSPLARPVVTFDPYLLDFYNRISEVWYDEERGVAGNVTLVSVSGGDSDVQVPFHLTIPPSHPPQPHTPSIASAAVPRNWVPADHRAVVWCRRLQLALSRGLFLLQTPPTNELTSDPTRRREVLHHLLFRGWTVPMTPSNAHLSTNRWKLVDSTPHYHEGSQPSVTALSVSSTSSSSSSSSTSSSSSSSTSLLVATNSATTHWLYVCSSLPSTTAKAKCTDFSHRATLLPPREKVVKYVRLGHGDLEGASHVVVMREKMERSREKEFVLMEWCREESLSLDLPLSGMMSSLHLPPSSHCTLTEITLPQLTQIWTAHSAIITSPCTGVKGGLVLPQLPHTPLLHSNKTGRLVIPLSLQVPVGDASAELIVWSPSNCSLSVALSSSFLPLTGKLLVLYTPLLLPWVTAVAMVSPRKHHHLVGEMVVLTIMWGVTSMGLVPATDWEQLMQRGLWPVWVPLLLHLVACGLFSILRTLLNIPSLLLSRCFHDSRVLVGVMMAMCGPALALCAAAGLLCSLVAYSLKVMDSQRRHVQSLLVCLLFLSLPSLFSWLKNLRYSLQLTPDPLLWPVGVASIASLLSLLLPSQPHKFFSLGGGCGFTSVPLPLVSPSYLLSLCLLLYCSIHAYRLSYFVAAATLLSAASQLCPTTSKQPPKTD